MCSRRMARLSPYYRVLSVEAGMDDDAPIGPATLPPLDAAAVIHLEIHRFVALGPVPDEINQQADSCQQKPEQRPKQRERLGLEQLRRRLGLADHTEAALEITVDLALQRGAP